MDTFLPKNENEAWIQTDPRHRGNFLALHGYDIIGLQPDNIPGAECRGVSKSGMTEYWILPDWEWDFCETDLGYNTVVHDHPSGDASYVVNKEEGTITILDYDNKVGIEDGKPHLVHTQEAYWVDGFVVRLHDWEKHPFPFLGAALSRLKRKRIFDKQIAVRTKEPLSDNWRDSYIDVRKYSNIWGTFWNVEGIFLNGELSFMEALERGLQILATRNKRAYKLGHNPPTKEDLVPSSVKVYWRKYFKSLGLDIKDHKPGVAPRRRRRRKTAEA